MPEWIQTAVLPGLIAIAFGMLWRFAKPEKIGLMVSKMINTKVGKKAGELIQKKANEWVDAFQKGMNQDNRQ